MWLVVREEWMFERCMRGWCVGLLALSLAMVPAWPQGKGKGHHKQDGDDDEGHGKKDKKWKHEFDRHDHDVVVAYYSQRATLPPGLAKRGGNLPPGIEKHLERNGTLPPGLQKRLQPCPVALERQLPPLEPEYRRAVIGAHLVIYNRNTNVVVDIMKDVVH
jgi:hypothetical protein